MIKKSLLIAFSLMAGLTLAQEKPADKPAAPEPLSNDSLTKELQAIKKDLEIFKKIKVTGWVQAQVQFADSNGVANFDGGNFSPLSDKRVMIRRGRVKFTWSEKTTTMVLQINGTERGMNLVEAYGIYMFPKLKSFGFSAGIMNRPFGFEIDQSSSVRESPERSRYTQILMPNERDLGAKIIFAPLKESKLHGLRLDAGMYSGQGIYVPGPTTPSNLSPGYPSGTIPVLGLAEFDFGKDFIGRLSYYRDVKNIRFGLGASHYNGGIINQSNVVFNSIKKDTNGVMQWVAADTTSGAIYKARNSKRMYIGVEAFFSIKSVIGTTTFRGEYVSGTQPGTIASSQSPFYLPTGNSSVNYVGTATKIPLSATYVRNFNGMYAMFIHRIAKTKHEIVFKYEWYDPNTGVKGSDVLGTAKNSFTSADIKYTQMGVGYNYYFDQHALLMIYYNMITNEITGDGKTALNGFQKDIKDNILTIRLQYKF